MNRKLLIYLFTATLLLVIALFVKIPAKPKNRQPTEKESIIAQREITEACRSKADCPADFFCSFGKCRKFEPATACKRASDCILVNKNFNYDCCSQSGCGEIDYSQPEWLAVNEVAFLFEKNNVCKLAYCGKNSCESTITNNRFEARCVFDVCVKDKKLY